MTDLATEASTPMTLSPSRQADTPRFVTDVADSLDAIEGLWRSFEAEAVATPYQRFDWVRSYAGALAARDGFEARALVVRGAGGRPLLLLPLAVRRRHGLTVASFIGGKQANFNVPLAAPGLSGLIPPGDVRALILDAGRRALGIDAFVFRNLPLAWRGEPNPLAGFGGLPSPSNGFKLSLDPDPERTIARAFSPESRKKMRKKLRYASNLGAPTYAQARTGAEVDAILGAFFLQKESRFREMGIDNPFCGPVRDFIRAACLAGLEQGRPAIELYAFHVGDRILATFGGAGDRTRFCGMFNSFENGDDVNRLSPGELLLAHVIRTQCERGREVFDLGVGEARYKSALCDGVEELVDVFLPATLRGRAYTGVLERLVRAKRVVKQTPWIWRVAGRLRLTRAKFL